MSSAGDRRRSSRRPSSPLPSQPCEDMKMETSDGGTSTWSEVKKEEMLELNICNHGGDLDTKSEDISIKEEDPDHKDQLYCEICKSFFFNKCEVHGSPLFIRDTPVPMGVSDRARQTLPPGLEIQESSIPDAGLGVFNKGETVPVGAHFGPYQGELVDREDAMNSGYSWAALDYFSGVEDSEEENLSSDWDSEDSYTDKENGDLSFASQPTAEQPPTQPPARYTAGQKRPLIWEEDLFDLSDKHSEVQDSPTASKLRRGTRTGQTSHSSSQSAKMENWKTEHDQDIAPPPFRFRPLRTPGVQVDTTVEHSPLNLFQLFFSSAVVKQLCSNTNKYAAQNSPGKTYDWEDVNVEEFYKFLGLVLYTSLVKLPNIQDYWRRDSIMSVPFPGSIMTRIRFQSLMWNLHLSDPKQDQENDGEKCTPGFDKLFCIRPLLDNMRVACKSLYHPKRELAIDDRMVATKAKTGLTQYIKNKPTKWGIKLFVLTDSCNGYTVDFSVYVGKSRDPSIHGLSHDVVLDLVQPLGTGYHIYMDNFYTSPKLFNDLAAMKFGACGTYRESRKGFPNGQGVLTKKSPRGTVRWIRQDSIVFVKWMDTREVSVCSTIHPAFSGDTVQRTMKDKDGKYKLVAVPCPVPVLQYNKYMGGVDRSDQLSQYYSTHRRASCWYHTLFLHFLDIACTNAYIMHLELADRNKSGKLAHKEFVLQLVSELCGVEKTGIPTKRQSDHLPVACAKEFNSANRATVGRRRCQNCAGKGVRNTTPWKCKACDTPLCLMLDRNCFGEWHA
ncbi:piggyBac transposable element-derived protein 4-like [Clarias gariepinus]|uniref:piggyBac transposable element-derived protein 4-like n=1 Tax=Clarias gariepinus TaxID=13013 RepID=UPI00234CBFA4|nr:piggyBac transposable element-derived protein 4-like [Clarias gariepinus]